MVDRFDMMTPNSEQVMNWAVVRQNYVAVWTEEFAPKLT